jgi:hypothetical protein
MIVIAKIFGTNVSLRNLGLSLRKLPFSQGTFTQEFFFGGTFIVLWGS